MAFTESVRKSAASAFSYGFVVIMVLYGFLPGVTYAADGELNIANTGSNSDNSSSVNEETDTNVSIRNEANVSNSASLNLNTGGNTVSQNTTVDGNVTTGSINFSLTAVTNANNNTGNSPTVTGTSGPTSNISSNISNTGANSSNNTSTNLNNALNISEENIANVANLFNIQANTGDNKITKNTFVGGVSSGNINVAINVENNVNSKKKEEGKGGVSPGQVGNGGGNPSVQPTPSASPTPRIVSDLPTGGAQLVPKALGGAAIIPAGANLRLIAISLLVIIAVAALSLATSRVRRV